jgi:hypothetical protein
MLINYFHFCAGAVPGPILFGVVIDSTCLVWQDSCGEHTSCWIYDNASVGRNFFLLLMGLKLLSTLLYMLAYIVYKPPNNTWSGLTTSRLVISYSSICVVYIFIYTENRIRNNSTRLHRSHIGHMWTIDNRNRWRVHILCSYTNQTSAILYLRQSN